VRCIPPAEDRADVAFLGNAGREDLQWIEAWDSVAALSRADSFGRDDLLHLARAAEKAFDYINSLLRADEE
jgi:hypothetical protein